MWFKVKAVDATYIDRAKRHFTYDFTVAGDPAAVFTAITEPEAMRGWFPDLVDARMITAPPPAVGSVREVTLAKLAVRERYLVYAPGERFTFCITDATLPLLTHMVEDFRLSAAPQGTRCLWTIAYRPRAALLPLSRFVRPVFARLFERGTAALEAHMGGSSAS